MPGTTDHKTSDVLVRVHGLSKSFSDGASTTTVFNGIDLDIVRGDSVSLVGSSGSGKSTLVGLLAGLARPDAGVIWFGDCDFTALDPSEQARFRADKIGVVLQRGNLFPYLSALENVEFASALAGRGSQTPRARRLLRDLGLAHRAEHRPKRLSGGESQRVALAVALINEPDLLLADEVTGELDAVNADRILTLLLETAHASGVTVVYVTHDHALAERADHRLRLVAGQVTGERARPCEPR